MKKLQIFICLCFSLLFALCSTLLYADTQNITITGTVAPHASDFQLSLTNNATGVINQNQTITYTITYGTHLEYADTVTLEAYYLPGTLSGSSIYGMDYVTGSGGNTYGASPVVDLSNQKITWTIHNFPANTTNQTVSFQLRANGSYSGSSTITFPTKVRLLATGFTTSYQTSSVDYQYNSSLVTPTPTPTSTPNNTPTPTPTVGPLTPTPTPSPIPTKIITPSPTPTTQAVPTFSDISILNLNSNAADIGYIVTKPGTVALLFGASNQTLSPVQSQTNQASGDFSLTSLTPQTSYNFQLRLTGSNGTFSSEIFSFTTPVVSQVPQLAKTSVVITANDSVLYSANLTPPNGNPTSTTTTTPAIAVAPSTSYSLSFKITKTQDIKSVEILAKSTNVLGLATTAFAQDSSQNYPYVFAASNKGNGVYSANIANTLPPGNYNLFSVIRDTQGNITTEQIASVHILHPFQAISKSKNEPIEDVRIVLYQYDSLGKTYSIIPAINGITNPLYTDKNGQVNEQLPTGKYKAVFSRIGYKSYIAYFGVGTSPQDDFPTVYMLSKPITLPAIYSYYQGAFVDWMALNSSYIQDLHKSYRFFDLVGLVVIFCSVVVCLLLFLRKTGMSFTHLPYYFHHHGLLLLGQKTTPYVSGKIMDEDQLPVGLVEVFAIDASTHHVLRSTTSNKAGGFLFNLDPKKSYLLSCMKQGYDPIEEIPYAPGGVITLKRIQSSGGLLKTPLQFVEDFAVLFFEFLLCFSFILEIVLFPAFGLGKTVPFLLGSLLNLFLWFLYVREKRM